jgi:hypothetical protein
MKSLDSVLADVDASDQEIANETAPNQEVATTEQPSQEGEQEEGGEQDQGHDAQGALHAERNRVRRKYTETVADFEKRLTEASTGFETKLTTSLAENDKKWQQRFDEFASRLQPQQQQRQPEPEKVERPDFYENPDGFVDHGVRQHLDPVRKEIRDTVEFYSERDAVREHGREKVEAAFAAMTQAAQRDPEIRAAVGRLTTSRDPYGDVMAWHAKQSVISEVGNDPAAYKAKLREELKAEILAEIGGGKPSQPSAQQAQRPNANVTSLPSLNRVAAAADDDEEEDDPKEVFNSALRSGVRR